MKAKRFLVAVNFLVMGILACSGAGNLINPPNAAATNTALASMVKKLPLRPQMALGATWPYADGTTLVPVPAGPFAMGVAGGQDNPAHVINLSSFWIYRTEVTNQQYAYCVSRGKCSAPDPVDDPGFGKFTNLNDPVTGVAWQQATDYCAFVHGRLPTEAEWEKTARGPDANTFPWGNTAPSCDLLNFKNCVGKTTNVVSHPLGESYYHALDTAGNAFEWVADFYDSAYYPISPAQDPPGPESGTQRVVRSTGFTSKDAEVPTYVRRFQAPENHRSDLGLRCVVEGPAYFAPACEELPLSVPAGEAAAEPSVECPNVDVSVAPGDCGTNHATVTFTTTDPANSPILGMDACELIDGIRGSSNQLTYDCTSPGTAKIKAGKHSCLRSNSPAECAPHFILDPTSKTCKWDGTGGSGDQCLEDGTYSGTNQCCQSAPISASDYQICPAGSYLHEEEQDGTFVCRAHADREKIQADFVMPPAVCPNEGSIPCEQGEHPEGDVCMPGPCTGGAEIVHGDCEPKCTGHQQRDHDGNCVDDNGGGGGHSCPPSNCGAVGQKPYPDCSCNIG